MQSLTASVGQGGRNLSPDVLLVQGLLTACGFDPGRPDGRCGPMTIAGLSLMLQRYRAALPDDPLEGRRTRLLLLGPGAAPRPLVEDCAGLASAVSGQGWLALACDSEQAADQVLHTVHVFTDTGERVAELPRCRTPRLVKGDRLLCQSESVDAQGRVRACPATSCPPWPRRPRRPASRAGEGRAGSMAIGASS